MLCFTEIKGDCIWQYRYGNRYQMILLPQSIEEYVSTDDPARPYDAFVEAL